jgi:hypothetical protein
MDRYDELIKSLEKYTNIQDEYGHSIFTQTAETLTALQSDANEKQKLLDEALRDLAKCNDCKYCANLDQCSPHRIERNFNYGSCAKWQWRGAKTVVKAS